MMKFTPYLNFNGTCAAAFKFYEQVLGGKIEFMQTHAESPMKEHVPPDWQDKVIHVCLDVDGQKLMGSDSPQEHYKPAQGIYVSIHVKTPGEGKRIFDSLSQGGQVTMPYAETFWSPGFGMLVDRFGTPWMVNTGQ
jgi:PhnB protein